MTPQARVISLVVADMAAAVAFYRRLGLGFTSDTEDHEECELVDGFRLMLDTEDMIRSITPAWTKPTGSPRATLAFHFDSPDAVDAMFAELTSAGYRGEREPWDAFWGHRYATVLDPDGNGVDLYAELAHPPSDE